MGIEKDKMRRREEKRRGRGKWEEVTVFAVYSGRHSVRVNAAVSTPKQVWVGTQTKHKIANVDPVRKASQPLKPNIP